MARVRAPISMLVAATVLALAAGMMSLHAPHVRAQGSTVGVVDFYAPTPLGEYVGLTPERFAADELSALLSRAGGIQLSVVPRSAMQRAEQALRWQDTDVLHSARLRALAEAVGAERLVVGRIPLLVVNPAFPPTAKVADVNLVLQVFDQAEGRLTAETLQRAGGLGMDRKQAAELVLHDALQHALPEVLRWLGVQAH